MGRQFTCALCGEPLFGGRADRKFCSAACRQNSSRQTRNCGACKLHHPSVSLTATICVPCLVWDLIQVEKKELREVIEFLHDRRSCFYCGELATEKEHVVPRHTKYPTWVVLSCRECNNLAGRETHVSVLEKMDSIRSLRGKRYRKLLRSPEWTVDELEELSYNLRTSIEAQMRARDIVKTQLKWNPLALEIE